VSAVLPFRAQEYGRHFIRCQAEVAREECMFEVGLNHGITYHVVARDAAQKADVLRQMLGIAGCMAVTADGGLVGNLSVSENLALPLLYHQPGEVPAMDRRMAAVFNACGVGQGEAQRLALSMPGALAPFDRKLAAFVRAMLMEPELIVFDAVDEGLPPAEAQRALGFGQLFRLHFPFRTVVHLGYAAPPSAAPDERVIRL